MGAAPESTPERLQRYQVEGGEAELEGLACLGTLTDTFLPVPFVEIQRYGPNGVRKSFRFVQRGMPERMNARIQVVQMKFIDDSLPKQTQRGTCTAGEGLEIGATGQAVQGDYPGKQRRQRSFPTRISERAVVSRGRSRPPGYGGRTLTWRGLDPTRSPCLPSFTPWHRDSFRHQR